MSKKQKILRGICFFLGIMLVLSGVELLYSNYVIRVSRYTVSSEKLTGSFRIVFLADLHCREFGKDNSRLLKKLKAESPDLIASVCDLIDEGSDEEDVSCMCNLIRAASDIAPVYFGMGNHEYHYMRDRDASLPEKLASSGATVLDTEFLDLEINGNLIRLGGYMGYYDTPHMNTANKEKQAALFQFVYDFEDTDRYKILLNHIPTNWLDWNYRDKHPVDLVLLGHYHGGVVRIPILEQGLYAPYVGKFPPYTKGLFEGKMATCILTTGLAGSYGIPRFFNPPEIAVVDVRPGF